MVCPTCGKTLANIEELVESIIITKDNKKNTSKQKQENLQKIFEKHGYNRYCCRMRILSYVDEITIVK